MIVVDTNIIVYFHIQGDHTEAAVQAYTKDPVWIAPFLWRSEFRNTTLLYLRHHLLTLPQIIHISQAAESMMEDNEYFVDTDEVYQLAAMTTCSAYDCEFVALAKNLAVPLVTVDRKILRQFPTVAVSLEQFVRR